MADNSCLDKISGATIHHVSHYMIQYLMLSWMWPPTIVAIFNSMLNVHSKYLAHHELFATIFWAINLFTLSLQPHAIFMEILKLLLMMLFSHKTFQFVNPKVWTKYLHSDNTLLILKYEQSICILIIYFLHLTTRFNSYIKAQKESRAYMKAYCRSTFVHAQFVNLQWEVFNTHLS